MDKNDIIEYVMHTPHNTNRAVLSSMLNQLAEDGGGGSSDFSTAEVTVVNNSVNEVDLTIIYVSSTPMGDAFLSSLAHIDAQDTQTINAVLYNNNAFVDVYGLNVNVSGNASKGNDVVTITGDCTITINGVDAGGID